VNSEQRKHIHSQYKENSHSSGRKSTDLNRVEVMLDNIMNVFKSSETDNMNDGIYNTSYSNPQVYNFPTPTINNNFSNIHINFYNIVEGGDSLNNQIIITPHNNIQGSNPNFNSEEAYMPFKKFKRGE
jgi:hypothetical protein